MTGSPRPRLYLLDGLRLLAALMVAVHHYVGTARVNQYHNAVWDRPITHVLPDWYRPASVGWVGVEIFFTISGLVICMSSWGRRPRDFFVSRVIRLYPAYWTAVVVTTLTVSLFPGPWHRLAPQQILVNLTMLQQGLGLPHVDGAYWTLWSELRFYVLFLLVLAGGLTYRRVVLFCCGWAAVAAIAAASKLPLLVTVANPDGAWYFITGLALYLMYRFGPDALLWGILGLSWLMSQDELYRRALHEGHSSYVAASAVHSAAVLLLVLMVTGKVRAQWRWLVTAGALTYPLYLMHYTVGTTVISRLRGGVEPRLLVLGTLVGMLVLAWLVHRLVERPLSRWMKGALTRTFDRLGNPLQGREELRDQPTTRGGPTPSAGRTSPSGVFSRSSSRP